MDADTWVYPPETFSARINGACVCGAVRWSYDAPLATMLYCHCTICRKHHGTWFAAVVAGPLVEAIPALGLPLLAGWSRKSTLGKITGKPADDRLAASVTAALLSVQRGARIVRVHDVAATRDALAVLAAVEKRD